MWLSALNMTWMFCEVYWDLELELVKTSGGQLVKPQPQYKKRLPPAKKTLVSKSDLGRPLAKASTSSRIRAQVTQNRNRQKCRNVAYRTHSKERDKKRIPPAKKTLVSKSDLGRPLPKASNSSRIRAQVT